MHVRERMSEGGERRRRERDNEKSKSD